MESTRSKKQMNPIWWLIMGILILVIPTAVYLGFLIPKMQSEYIVLMSSGGIIGSAGITGCAYIPETAKYGTLYKTATKSFTMLIVITLIQDFIGQLLGLLAVLIVSYIIFVILRGKYRNGKQARQNADLADKVARATAEALK